jgi:hypothetical protein
LPKKRATKTQSFSPIKPIGGKFGSNRKCAVSALLSESRGILFKKKGRFEAPFNQNKK